MDSRTVEVTLRFKDGRTRKTYNERFSVPRKWSDANIVEVVRGYHGLNRPDSECYTGLFHALASPR
jgi:hypothetical protein